MTFAKFALGLKRCRALLAAALVLPLAVGLAAPAAAEPTFSSSGTITLSPGVGVRFPVRGVFENPGNAPRFTEVTFSDETYLDTTQSGFYGDDSPSFDVTVLTSAQLNALESPPPSPFTFTADVTMTNDDGETASGTLTFSATYVQTSSSTPSPSHEAETEPSIVADLVINAPPTAQIFISPEQLFENAGTYPRIIDAETENSDVYNIFQVLGNGDLTVQAISSDGLDALGTRSPVRGRVTVTMINAEHQRASGVFVLETTYIAGSSD